MGTQLSKNELILMNQPRSLPPISRITPVSGERIAHTRWSRQRLRRSLYRGLLTVLVYSFSEAVPQTRHCGSDVLSLVKRLNLKILNSVRIHTGDYGTHGSLPHCSGVLRIDALPSLRYNRRSAGGSCLKSEGAVARLLLA
jgi:hypothetical protein